MAGSIIFDQRIEDQRCLRRHHDFNGLHACGADQFCCVFADLVADFNDDLASSVAGGRVYDVVNCDFAFKLRSTAAIDNFDFFGFVERSQDVRIFAVLRVHGTQQRQSAELAALVDANGQRVFLRRIDFDPATTLRNHPAACQLTI